MIKVCTRFNYFWLVFIYICNLWKKLDYLTKTQLCPEWKLLLENMLYLIIICILSLSGSGARIRYMGHFLFLS